jgi:signal transduction histidine kinase/CheY-like chemotaxis protein
MEQIVGFAALAGMLPEGLAVVDVNGAVVEANPVARRLLDITDVGPACRLADFVADPPERVLAYLKLCARTRTLLPGSLHLRAAGEQPGERIYVEGGAIAIPGRDASPVILLRLRVHEQGVRTFVELNRKIADLAREMHVRERTIEERRKIDEKVQQAQKLESLAVLAGGVAHDFNNLLTSMLGYTELALFDLPPESPARASIEQTRRAALRAADLARQMLAYAGRGRLELHAIDLNTLVEEMGHLMKVAIARHVSLRFNLSAGLPPIEADPTQLRQVIMNLIINASEAIGSRSGIISITTGTIYADRDYLTDALIDEQLSEGWYVYLEVADTGAGMTDEVKARIFDPFYTTKFTGRGLGLAAALGIVRSHRGAIRVYSEVGRGTTFKILLPSTERQRMQARAVHDGADELSGLVLIVDDDSDVRSVMRRMLLDRGFSVLPAADGREALATIRTHADSLALIFLDLTMPHLDGVATYQEIQRMAPHVPVILCSGHSEAEALDRFAGRGLAGYLQKPFTRDQLYRVAQAALHASSQSAPDQSGQPS